MALATRCPHCKTTFRVVQDQLKLYSGMVRCGVCQQIFNGFDNLIKEDEPGTVSPDSDLNAENPPAVPVNPLAESPEAESPATAGKPSDWPTEEAGQTAEESAQEENVPALDLKQAVEEYEGFDSASLPQADEFAPSIPEEELPIISLDLDEGGLEASDIPKDDIDLPFDVFDQPTPGGPGPAEPNLGLEKHPWENTISNLTEAGTFEPTLEFPPYNQTAIDAYLSTPLQQEPSLDSLPPNATSAAPEPNFVRKAKSRQKSKRLSRILYAIGSLVLLILLALQGIYTFRESISVRMPWAMPVVSEICSAFECETQLSAKIDDLAIESSEMQSLPNRPGTFVLEIVLRNLASSAQAWPSIELTLNDESGQPVVRRVLPPAEYLADASQSANPEKGFPAQSEKNVKMTFTLEQVKTAGYRVYLFYP